MPAGGVSGGSREAPGCFRRSLSLQSPRPEGLAWLGYSPDRCRVLGALSWSRRGSPRPVRSSRARGPGPHLHFASPPQTRRRPLHPRPRRPLRSPVSSPTRPSPSGRSRSQRRPGRPTPTPAWFSGRASGSVSATITSRASAPVTSTGSACGCWSTEPGASPPPPISIVGASRGWRRKPCRWPSETVVCADRRSSSRRRRW